MKKYLYLMIVALFATMSVALTSCSSDDDEPKGTDGTIVGTWRVDTMKMGDMWQVDYVRFKENGTYESVAVINVTGELDLVPDSGTWHRDGNNITIDGLTAPIKELNDKKMVLGIGGGSITYNRCPDSEMDRYLDD